MRKISRSASSVSTASRPQKFLLRKLGVLLAYGSHVVGVVRRIGCEDCEIRVAQQLALWITRSRHMGFGQSDQPCDLVQVLLLQPDPAQLAQRQPGEASSLLIWPAGMAYTASWNHAASCTRKMS